MPECLQVTTTWPGQFSRLPPLGCPQLPCAVLIYLPNRLQLWEQEALLNLPSALGVGGSDSRRSSWCSCHWEPSGPRRGAGASRAQFPERSGSSSRRTHPTDRQARPESWLLKRKRQLFHFDLSLVQHLMDLSHQIPEAKKGCG